MDHLGAVKIASEKKGLNILKTTKTKTMEINEDANDPGEFHVGY